MGSLFGKEITTGGCSGRPQRFFAWGGTRVYSRHIGMTPGKPKPEAEADFRYVKHSPIGAEWAPAE
ncbi:hypothetical protein GWJ21_14810 [Bacillus coagulans]|nr:hypothetical protein [Heyndrickxia coagulans DSM 1 = ATCC 7050]NCG69131.1 hypothetical protein [Heyndrickxia coagulans]QJE31676.1 hypothetical protein HHU11_02810 [Heyndrickxia coagulans]RGR82533.1 hypothetical protein DWY22_11365 [Heyndrickxia coagulans]RGR98355.1 hypothetical protein DWY16_08095 [Heyndrickxia coagulans]